MQPDLNQFVMRALAWTATDILWLLELRPVSWHGTGGQEAGMFFCTSDKRRQRAAVYCNLPGENIHRSCCN